jgi:hypothetical protein
MISSTKIQLEQIVFSLYHKVDVMKTLPENGPGPTRRRFRPIAAAMPASVFENG